ncbi:MAG: hypothetical protein HZA34_02425 [Candidatus Pacebacteria bacterium]|nr:hypothetical protein [Candidatus Paceibacterota bacterium]
MLVTVGECVRGVVVKTNKTDGYFVVLTADSAILQVLCLHPLYYPGGISFSYVDSKPQELAICDVESVFGLLEKIAPALVKSLSHP